MSGHPLGRTALQDRRTAFALNSPAAKPSRLCCGRETEPQQSELTWDNTSVLRLEQRSRKLRLANDRLKRPDPKFRMVRDRHRDGRVGQGQLHDDVTASLPDFDKALFRKERAHVSARQSPQLTQR